LLPSLKILFEAARRRNLNVESPDIKYTLGSYLRVILDDGLENDEEDTVRIHSMLLAGMSPNIVTFRSNMIGSGIHNNHLPLLIDAIKHRMFKLVEYILNHPDLVVTPEMLAWMNTEYSPIDRIREMMIARIRGPEKSRKRSRYELDESE
jgi:hypothetical protein